MPVSSGLDIDAVPVLPLEQNVAVNLSTLYLARSVTGQYCTMCTVQVNFVLKVKGKSVKGLKNIKRLYAFTMKLILVLIFVPSYFAHVAKLKCIALIPLQLGKGMSLCKH